MDTMSPILPGSRCTGVNYGLGIAASGGRRQCLHCVVVHIRKGMRDELARRGSDWHWKMMGWAGNLHRPDGRTERNTKTCGAGEQALTISLISTKSGP